MVLSTSTILLVGFEPVLGQVVKDTLAMEGYNSDEVPEGADPVGYSRQSRPAAVVVYAPADLRRIHGVPDIFASFASSEATRSIPIVAVPITLEGVEMAGANQNVVAIVEAPFDLELLVKAIRRAVVGHRP